MDLDELQKIREIRLPNVHKSDSEAHLILVIRQVEVFLQTSHAGISYYVQFDTTFKIRSLLKVTDQYLLGPSNKLSGATPLPTKERAYKERQKIQHSEDRNYRAIEL